MAMSTFYESGGASAASSAPAAAATESAEDITGDNDGDASDAELQAALASSNSQAAVTPNSSAQAAGGQTLSGAPAPAPSPTAPLTSRAPQRNASIRPTSNKKRFGTFATLGGGGDDDSDGDDDKKPQNFFTGGEKRLALNLNARPLNSKVRYPRLTDLTVVFQSKTPTRPRGQQKELLPREKMLPTISSGAYSRKRLSE